MIPDLNKMFAKGERIRVSATGRLCNGHWALMFRYPAPRVDVETLKTLYPHNDDIAPITDDQLALATGTLPDKPVMYTATAWLKERVDGFGKKKHAVLARRFDRLEGEGHVLIDERYVKQFDLNDVFCADDSGSAPLFDAAKTDEARVCVMPWSDPNP